jgi:hypothetical protein
MNNIKELIKQYEEDSGMHSVPSGMMNSLGFKEIVELGDAAVKPILEHLKINGGMNIMLLLSVITKQEPNYKPDPIGNSGIAAYSVADYRHAWLQWGREHGYIK